MRLERRVVRTRSVRRKLAETRPSPRLAVSTQPLPVSVCATLVPAQKGPAVRTARTRRLPSSRPLLALATVSSLLALAGCGDADAEAGKGAGGASAPSEDVVKGVKQVDTIAAQLPADIRKRGTLRIATSIGAPPGAFRPEGGGSAVGQDIDIADAAAKVLGVKLAREEASFETILPALGSGKYDVGTGNFGVTDERRRTIDFVTYINDGQGFAVRKDDDSLDKVTELTQLCGKNIGVNAGTTFETTLAEHRGDCAAEGRKPYTVKVFSEDAASLTSLQQGRLDVIMSTINGLRHQASEPAAGTRFLGEYHRLDVGFALKKGSPLAKPFQAAVNELISNGTYERILKKWGTSASLIQASEISPPERKKQ